MNCVKTSLAKLLTPSRIRNESLIKPRETGHVLLLRPLEKGGVNMKSWLKTKKTEESLLYLHGL